MTTTRRLQSLRPLDGSPLDNAIAFIVTELQANGQAAAVGTLNAQAHELGAYYQIILDVLKEN